MWSFVSTSRRAETAAKVHRDDIIGNNWCGATLVAVDKSETSDAGSTKSDRVMDWWERSDISPQLAIFLRRLMLTYERRLRVPHSVSGKAKTAERLNRTRFAADKRRNMLKRISRPRPRNLSIKQLLARQIESPVLAALFPQRKNKWRPIMDRKTNTELDVVDFSFLTAPEAAMRVIQRIAEIENVYADVRVNFLDDDCLDIGAMLVLEEMWRKLTPVFTGGKITPDMSAVIETLGLRKAFGWRKMKPSDRIFPFPIRRQERPAGSELSTGVEPRRSAIIATELIKFIDGALRSVTNVMLTKNARQKFGALIGEILDNAGTHATEDKRGGYTISGFVSHSDAGGTDRFRFHLGFLSVGQTIAESLADAPEQIRPALDRYVNAHRGRHGLTDENLVTVYAIRDGVTRLREKLSVVDGKSLGGTGLADILDFFSSLSLMAHPDDQPTLAIVSGATYILIRKPYSQAERRRLHEHEPPPETAPRELWFNEANDPDLPPDPKHVFRLPGNLAGTLVTMAFDIDPDLLEKLENARNRPKPAHER